MTEYLKKSFMVRMGQGRAPKPEKCVRCGVLVDPVIYRLNREPRCQDCFKDPRRVLSTNNNQTTTKGTEHGIYTNTDKNRKDREIQQTAEGTAGDARAR